MSILSFNFMQPDPCPMHIKTMFNKIIYEGQQVVYYKNKSLKFKSLGFFICSDVHIFQIKK